MRTRRKPAPEPTRNDVDAALAAMGADELRVLVRDMLLELDARVHSRVVNSLITRAARGGSGWAPAALSDEDVSEVLDFAKAAERAGSADPSDVDEYLRRGTGAFLRKDYAVAHQVLGALLAPIGEGRIDLGQREMVDEVLGVDPGQCAAQYVVSAYMISAPARRAEAVRSAIDEVCGVGYFMEPIQQMERAAVEPLPQLDDFLPQWRAVVAEEAGGERQSDWDTDEDRWLREVVRRVEGAGGLAKVARSTRRASDLRAWCQALVEAGDWKAALSAFEEAADLVADREHATSEFLDGAALAAQEVGRSGLPSWLERAWRSAPSMLRLRRWLGSARGKAATRKRAAEALEACPKQADRQRAFLLVLRGDFESAAKLLEAAPGLGWSHDEHPGHLLYPVFEVLLGGKRASACPSPAPLGDWCRMPTERPRSAVAPDARRRDEEYLNGIARSANDADWVTPPAERPSAFDTSHLGVRGMDIDELELLTAEPDEPRVAAPEVSEILRQAGVDGVPKAGARSAMLAAMRKAAERRLAGVTEHKRRRHYGHAAHLVAVCLACERSPEAVRWVSSLRAQYSRFPALRAEIDRQVGSS